MEGLVSSAIVKTALVSGQRYLAPFPRLLYFSWMTSGRCEERRLGIGPWRPISPRYMLSLVEQMIEPLL